LRSWIKYNGNQNTKNSTTDKSNIGFSKFRKQIELIGIEVNGLDEKAETGRLELKTRFINQHFINELDKIGLQLINIRGTWLGSIVVLLEQRNFNLTSAQ
jgi:2,3-bisphosphoglycerate-independent phosphoglycerate mutase